MDKKFHLMRLSLDGRLAPIAGIRGHDTIDGLEERIKGTTLRDTGNPLVIVEIVSTVKIETHINVQPLPKETMRKAGK